MAEGSRSLYPSGYEAAHTDEGRANLDLGGTGTVYLGVVPRRTFIYVYAQAGEHILVGSRNRTANNVGNINVYDPQSFGTKGYETIPGSADFVCSNATDGLIDTRAKELAGPRSANGSGNPSGYVPCVYVAPSDGVYGVMFSVASAGGNPNGVVDPPAASTNSVSAWDVTVRSSDPASTTDINGRVFTYAWSSFTNGNGAGRRLYSNLYYVSDDGYRYRQSLQGIDPNAGTFFANALGFRDQGQPLYKDIRGTNQPVSSGLPAGVTADNAQYPIFFSDVSDGGGTDIDTTLTALGIALAPKPPQVSSFSFSYPPASSSTSYLGQGGTFSFSVTDTISFQIIISHDGTDWDPATPQNRVITGVSGTGDYSIPWDGKDNAGNNLPVGTGYQFRITGRNGEAHFPFVDVEGNLYGGPVVTKLNGNITDSLVYYDDRGYLTKGGTTVGTVNGHICGNPAWPQPTPAYSLTGIDSASKTFNNGTGVNSAYARWWPDSGQNANTDCASANQYFGDTKALNLWTYQTTTPQSNTFNIIDVADVKATVSAPVSTTASGVVTVNVGFGNVGSQNAASTTYAISLATGLSGVSCGGATCNYNSSTGIVAITGLPGSLSPGQWAGMTISYAAPGAGSIGIIATVATSTDQGPNLAPDFASAVTLVGGTPDADVLTTLSPPPVAVAGGTVNVQVRYANVGATLATSMTYTLTLPSGLTNVSCAGGGVTCVYDAGTGAVGLTGLPGTLTPGQDAPFTLSYTAPAAGTSVPVTSSVTTSAAENNASNNNASGMTTVIGASTMPDAVAIIVAPATTVPGSAVDVQVSFSNVGDVSATGVTYALSMPSGLSDVSCPAPAICSYSSVTGAVMITGLPPALASGEWASLNLRYTAPLTGVVSVQANISTTTPGGETNTSNNTATASTTVVSASTLADVIVTLTPPANAAPGVTVNVPVSVGNLAATSADGMTYGVTLPASLAGVSCSGNGVTCTYDAGTGVVSLSGLPGTLAPGQSVPFTLTYTAPASGSVPVIATIATTTFDANTGNNAASGTTTIGGGTTTDVTTTVAPPSVATAGSTVSVPVTFVNVGAITAAGMTYNITFTGSPTGITVSNGGAACGYDSGTGATTGCVPSTLTPGQTLNLTVGYVSPSTGTVGILSTVGTSTTESNTANNTANASTLLIAPDMSISLGGLPTSLQVGAPYSGTFSCSNVGTADATAGTTCSVSGLPPNIVVGACTITPASVDWIAGDLVPVGQTVTCSVSGTSDTPGSVTLTGVTSATGDSNSANDSATLDLTLNAAAQPGAVQSIPSLSRLGMILLSSLLALGTIITLRRQRQ
ncbi:MAG: hypothetical protein GC183_13190 [Thiobacillus sp.]|nr:hypothetical protein [Thiobacillus sp.]